MYSLIHKELQKLLLTHCILGPFLVPVDTVMNRKKKKNQNYKVISAIGEIYTENPIGLYGRILLYCGPQRPSPKGIHIIHN